MRVWLLALFLVAFNLTLSILGSGGLNFWYSTGVNNESLPGQRYDFETHTWYTPDYTNGSYRGEDPLVIGQARDLKGSTKGLGESFLVGFATAIFGDAGGAVAGGLTDFWDVITGIFTSTRTLLVNLNFPDYFATAIQVLVDLVIVYGGLQFFLGRSGKTIE